MRLTDATSCLIVLLLMMNAERVNAHDLLEMSLEELMQVKVSGATLRHESIKNVPSAVTVFTAEQIDQMGMDYLYELLGLVPGFQTARGGDYPTEYAYSARGRRIGSQSREVLVLVDGRDVSDPRSFGADATFNLFPLELIERVEIIRGPSSALYGANAVNGTINIITRKNRHKTGLSLGANNRREGIFQAAKSAGDWHADIAIKAFRDTGEEYWLERKSAPRAASADPIEGVYLNGSIGNQATTLRTTSQQLKSKQFYIFESVSNDFNSTRQTFNQFELEHQFQSGKNLSSKVSLNYLYTEQNVQLEILPAGALAAISTPSSNAPLYGKAVIKAQNYKFMSANDWTVTSQSSVQFGLSLLKNDEIQATTFNNYNLDQLTLQQYPISYHEDFGHSTQIGLGKVQTAAGVYAQYLGQINADTRITLGGRYDRYDAFGGHLSPRMGIIHQLNEQQTLKVVYGEAFRAPALAEVGLVNNAYTIGNPDLTYETIKTWELIWQAQWMHGVVSVDAFHSQYKNPISAGFVGATQTQLNGQGGHTSGIELEASREFLSYFLLRATYTRLFELPEESFR
ncbi:MAG: hypothetical protein RL497_1031, partial [Pseudomonadota bacterium]